MMPSPKTAAGVGAGAVAEDGGTAATAALTEPIERIDRSELKSRLNAFSYCGEHFSRPSGPPAGYQPILLPGESISKYQRYQQPPVQESQPSRSAVEVSSDLGEQPGAPLAAAFPEDEPIFAAPEALLEPLHEQHEHVRRSDEPVESASTSTSWNQQFRNEEEASSSDWTAEAPPASDDQHETETAQVDELSVSVPEHLNDEQTPAFAAPGTMEEETIEDEEADTLHYESSSDEGYEEFEEETQAANGSDLMGDARDAVSEIHLEAAAESGELPAEGAAAAEEDSEDAELEEAQAKAEAMLDAEARGNGTVDARAEVRAPATAGYTQRTPQRRERPGYERRDRGRRGGGGGGRSRFRRRESAAVPLISDLLKEGQEILVQIAKEPIGKKGARITSHIALARTFPGLHADRESHGRVAQDCLGGRAPAAETDHPERARERPRRLHRSHGCGRSASEEELRADIRFLKGLWQDIKNRAESSKPPALIYHDLNVVERVLRDQVTSDFSVIWVDTEAEYERILRFFNRFQPRMVKRVKLYTKETPLFEQFGLAEEMNKALKSKVWLKSGGYIVINQTEALVAIDINTGKYVGKTARLEDTIVKTNVDAIKEIVRQIRLRDLGGIIMIDFIDMDERRNRQHVMQALEEELRHDRAPSKIAAVQRFRPGGDYPKAR